MVLRDPPHDHHRQRRRGQLGPVQPLAGDEPGQDAAASAGSRRRSGPPRSSRAAPGASNSAYAAGTPKSSTKAVDRTVTNAEFDRYGRNPPLRTLPSCSNVGVRTASAGTVETVSRVTSVSGGDAYPIFGPLVLPDRRTTETLRRQPGIAETFGQFRLLTKAVVSIGAWQPGGSTVYDALDETERAAIAARGATAEVAARLFDASGNALSTGRAQSREIRAQSRELRAQSRELRAQSREIRVAPTPPGVGPPPRRTPAGANPVPAGPGRNPGRARCARGSSSRAWNP